MDMAAIPSNVLNPIDLEKMINVIDESGKESSFHLANDKEYQEELIKKVMEELEEFKENPCEEEMADIFEVLEALMKFHNLDEDRLLEIKAEKVKKKGAFEKRIVLERVWEE